MLGVMLQWFVDSRLLTNKMYEVIQAQQQEWYQYGSATYEAAGGPDNGVFVDELTDNWYCTAENRPAITQDEWDRAITRAVHGIGGIWGALATGIFADMKINSGGDDGCACACRC